MPVYQRGDTSWIDFRYGDKRYRRPVANVTDGSGKKKTKAAAEEALVAIKARIAAGTFDPGDLEPKQKPDGTTIDTALRLYPAHVTSKGKPDRSYSFLDQYWAPHFAGRPIASITGEEIEETLQEWAEQRKWSPASRNDDVNRLSGLFSYAYGRRRIDSHPTEKGRVAMLPTTNERTRWLRLHEIDALLAAAGEVSKDDDVRADTQAWLRDTLPDIIWTDCGMGMCFSEVCDLRMSSLQKDDKQAAYLETGKTRNGTCLTYPLEGPVLKIVQARADTLKFPGSYLFQGPRKGNSESSIKRWLPVSCEKAKLVDGRDDENGITFHSFRRTMASHAMSNGVPEVEVQTLGNWKTASVTRRYGHLSDERLRQAAGTVASIVCGHTVLTTTDKPQAEPTRGRL